MVSIRTTIYLNAPILTSNCDPVLFLLIPDQVQPRVFNAVAPKLKDSVAIVVASGYNVFYKLLHFRPTQDITMVAPRFVSIEAL